MLTWDGDTSERREDDSDGRIGQNRDLDARGQCTNGLSHADL